MLPERNTYEICVRGHLDGRWVSWFEGLKITHGLAQDGTPVTRLSGSIADQAALHGVLIKLRDIGIPIISVNSIQSIQSEEGEDNEE